MLKKTQATLIHGDVGMLECRVGRLRPGFTPAGLVVLAHPHPLHGGTMNNKVVTTMEKAFADAGWQTLAFNFRGVGLSDGVFDQGQGEQRDLASVIHWGQGMFGDLPLALAGFSFGSYMILKQAEHWAPARVLTVAPPVNLYDFSGIEMADNVQWSLIQGGADEVVPAYKVSNWMRGLRYRPDVFWRERASHYFHGELVWLRRAVELGLL
jgi:alpha/beta superfamily hydrolase